MNIFIVSVLLAAVTVCSSHRQTSRGRTSFVTRAQIGRICNEMVTLKEEIGTLKKENGNQQKEIVSLKEEIGQQKEEISQQKEELSQQKVEIGQQKEELSQQKEEIGQQKEEISQQKEEISQQKEKLSQQKEEISQQKEEISQQKEEISQIQQQNTEFQNRLEDLEESSTGAGPQSAVQSAFAIFGQNPIEAESTVGFNVMTVPDSGVWTNIGDDFNVTTGFYTARYNGTYVFVLNVYKDDTINDRVYCNIRRNNIMVAIANVPNFNDFQHYHGGTGATVLSLKQVDTVSVGDCSEVSHLNYFTSFIGFLLAVDPPEEED